jgi:4a-hydroxytetrahydrobiopterin dehydratase
MRFIDRMAEVAKASRHHPDFCCHYDAVDVTVTTHSEGGVTAADLALARAIETTGAEPNHA